MDIPLLSVKNLRAWYKRGTDVLSGLSVDLGRHETVGLIGLNGAGKTTFLKILSGLLSSFASDGICFNGHPVSLRGDFKTHRYTVFAEDDSFSFFTFREYLAYVFAAYGKPVPDVSPLVEGFGFSGCTDMLLRDLSTGNRKKVYLITGLALKPELLLLDEPVNGLDFQSTEFLYQKISEYKNYGSVLFSSHILESVTLTSDRVLVLENGWIRQTFEGQICAADIREALHYEADR